MMSTNRFKLRNLVSSRFIALFIILVGLESSLQAQDVIKIACVGNSITYGAGVADRERNAYPAQLQAMLGAGYEVMNFGVSATTLLKKGNFPYWDTPDYREALASRPDIVFIKMGTNDSKQVNRSFYDEFDRDYKALIQSFRESGTNPRIILLLPAPSFLIDSNSIYDPVIKSEIIPRIRKVAYDTGVEVIDLHSLFIDKADLFPDQIHPSSLGATIIAKRLYEAVCLDEKRGYDVFSGIEEEKTIGSFYGYECADFIFKGRESKIVKPKKAVDGLPWVWRARFWGHEPQTDIALLERGFHVVYCDVAELFGNDVAIKSWDDFYQYMQKMGMAKKVLMEGMSRGGVYVYNWAAANPENVAGVYADAPVLDLRSWPGGKGKGKASATDWELVKKNYHLSSESEAAQFNGNPMDKITEIVKGKYPMLHVVGDIDEVVPVDENTGLFETKIKAAGGDITVIHKPEVGHHPHSLGNPSLIVDFMLRASGYKINFAALAAPGSEYRSGAGWFEGKGWWAQNDDINQLLGQAKELDVLFVGNSITQGTGGHRTALTARPGFSAFDQAFKTYSWENAGISGDRTQHVLWRLQNGNYAKANPKLLVLSIGVNNFADDTPEEIAAGILAIEQWVKNKMPETKVLLLGPLPAGLKKGDPYRVKYENVQFLLKERMSAQSREIASSIAKAFVKENGDLNLAYCSGDGIHLNTKGYEMWTKLLKPLVSELIDK